MENNTLMPEINAGEPEQKVRKILRRETKLKIFYACMIVLPLLHFFIYYIYINFDTVVMSFKTYFINPETNRLDSKWVGLQNFKTIFQFFNDKPIRVIAIRNSIIFYLFKLIVGMSIALIFSFYIYKKFLFSEFFRVVLFLPNLISSILMVVLFRYIVGAMYTELTGAPQGLLSNPDTQLGTIIFFNLWLGLASQILMFSSAMSGINESIVESAQLDGINQIKEFWYITLPMIFPTFITFVATGMAACFTDQMNLYTFEGPSAVEAPFSTIGYMLYVFTLNSTQLSNYDSTLRNPQLSYPELTALGLLISFVTVPAVMITKRLLEKYGPSAN